MDRPEWGTLIGGPCPTERTSQATTIGSLPEEELQVPVATIATRGHRRVEGNRTKGEHQEEVPHTEDHREEVPLEEDHLTAGADLETVTLTPVATTKGKTVDDVTRCREVDHQ